MAARRDIAPLLRSVRDFLLGRKHTVALRFEDSVSPRTQPQPILPDGVAHKLYANHYVVRDARRSVAPPVSVAQQVLLGDGQTAVAPAKKTPTPGKVFQWD